MTAQAFRVAAVQMVSAGEVAGNLAQAATLVAAAAAEGARLIVLPEYFGIIGARATDKVAARERDGDGAQQAFLAEAALRHGIWLVGGSVPIAIDDPQRVLPGTVLLIPSVADAAKGS